MLGNNIDAIALNLSPSTSNLEFEIYVKKDIFLGIRKVCLCYFPGGGGGYSDLVPTGVCR